MFRSINGGKLPTKATKYSACVDLYANEDVVIGAGETKVVPLGVMIDLYAVERIAYYMRDELGINFYDAFMSSHKLDLHIRSSLSAKHGLIIANGTGQIDLDFPNEIGIILHNPITGIIEYPDGYAPFGYTCNSSDIKHQHTIVKGDRIAQITLVEHQSYLFGIESEEERTGGYGSTDKNYKEI